MARLKSADGSPPPARVRRAAIDALAERIGREGRAMLVVIVAAAGSTPRERGAAMAVGAAEASGTIGGGSAEHAAMAAARAILTDPAPAGRIERFRLNPILDQCCGGTMDVAIAPFTRDDLPRLRATGPLALWEGGPVVAVAPPPRTVIVHGGGHVGRALVAALAPLPFAVRWVDSRPDGYLEDAPAGVSTVLTPLPEAEAKWAPEDAFHLVMTHSHALDLEIVAAVLDRNAFGFLGLIGSATKRALFARRLAGRGLPGEAIARLVCPIGLPGIPGKDPAVIAAATAAQLLAEDAAARVGRDGDAPAARARG